MKSKTKISKHTEKKFNPNLVETINLAKKTDKWKIIAHLLSGPRRKMANLNLSEIDKLTGQEKAIIIPGKILSQGDLNKKIKVVALDFSEKAKEKLLSSGCVISNIIEEIKSNPQMKEIKLINIRDKNENN